MSAFRIAREATAADREADRRVRGGVDDERQSDREPSSAPSVGRDGHLQGLLDKLTKWIPGDTLALYAPGVTVLSATTEKPSLLFLVIMILVTPLFVLGVAFSAGGGITRRTLTAAGLAMVAFTIWSASVPSSGWQSVAGLAANQGALAIGAAIAGILFGYFAEGITKRLAH